MEWVILVLMAVGIAVYLIKTGEKKKNSRTPLPQWDEPQLATLPKQRTPSFPYRKIGPLLTPAERSFYGILMKAVNSRVSIFSKVRVSDVVAPEKGLGRSGYQKAFNRISSKHFDFVLCKPDDLSVLAVIELDDSSHQKQERKARDSFLEEVCKKAELKLFRVKAKRAYTVDEIRTLLFPPRKKTAGNVGKLQESTAVTDASQTSCAIQGN